MNCSFYIVKQIELLENKSYDKTYEQMNIYSFVLERRKRMLDVIIVGAGQAGLTMGYYLKQEGYNFYYLRQETELVIHGETDMILYSSLHRGNIVVYQV